MPYRVSRHTKRPDLSRESYFFGTLAVGMSVVGIWMVSLHLYEYAVAELISATFVAVATHEIALRSRRR